MISWTSGYTSIIRQLHNTYGYDFQYEHFDRFHENQCLFNIWDDFNYGFWHMLKCGNKKVIVGLCNDGSAIINPKIEYEVVNDNVYLYLDNSEKIYTDLVVFIPNFMSDEDFDRMFVDLH